jgi:hypothetical protein
MVPHDAAPVDERDRVLGAVREELSRWGIDRFDIAATTERHGLDPQLVAAHWPDSASLVLDALAHRPDDDYPPDTGSLVEDLYLLALGMATLVGSEDGPKLHGAHLITDPDLGTVGIRRAAWRARADALRVVFDRARDRDEIRAGVDAETSLEMLFAPINMRVLYTGEPVTDQYCRTLADMVWRSVARHATPAHSPIG